LNKLKRRFIKPSYWEMLHFMFWCSSHRQIRQYLTNNRRKLKSMP